MQLVVMAKYPRPGAVKTRLARRIGSEGAAALYRAFVSDLAARLAHEGFDVWWAYWPADAPFESLVPGARCVAQRGDDLGERMANAAADVAGRCGQPVVLLGADVPHVATDVLDAAARALAETYDVAIGPSEDGGYYVLGLRTVRPELFTGVGWGSAVVLEQTLARCRDLGLRVAVLPTTFDVDEADDLERLGELVTTGATALPRTRAVLERLRTPSRCRPR